MSNHLAIASVTATLHNLLLPATSVVPGANVTTTARMVPVPRAADRESTFLVSGIGQPGLPKRRLADSPQRWTARAKAAGGADAQLPF